MSKRIKKAVFIDKDGTLIIDVPYNVDPKKVVFYKDVPLALHQLQKAGYKIIVITNQMGIAQGFFKEKDLQKIKKEISSFLSGYGVSVDGFYYCPHFPNGKVKKYSFFCDCRKPQPGMLLKAARELNINLKKSWMIGDILDDVEAGNAALCRTVLIANGNETNWQISTKRIANYIARSVQDAAGFIELSEQP